MNFILKVQEKFFHVSGKICSTFASWNLFGRAEPKRVAVKKTVLLTFTWNSLRYIPFNLMGQWKATGKLDKIEEIIAVCRQWTRTLKWLRADCFVIERAELHRNRPHSISLLLQHAAQQNTGGRKLGEKSYAATLWRADARVAYNSKSAGVMLR